MKQIQNSDYYLALHGSSTSSHLQAAIIEEKVFKITMIGLSQDSFLVIVFDFVQKLLDLCSDCLVYHEQKVFIHCIGDLLTLCECRKLRINQ